MRLSLLSEKVSVRGMLVSLSRLLISCLGFIIGIASCRLGDVMRGMLSLNMVIVLS